MSPFVDGKNDSKIVLGMIMLKDENSFDLKNFVMDYNQDYGKTIDELTGDNSSVVFKIDGEMVAVAHIPVHIPGNDIESTAQYAYNWPTVLEDTKGHKSHLIVSIMSGTTDQIKRFKVFTEVVCSLLRITNSIGVYEGNQSLLLPKEDFLGGAKFMSQEYLPLNLWIYFGLRRNTTGNSAYTYGLKEFGKIEMEVLNSTKSLEEIRSFIFNITHYVLDYDVTFHDGETCGVSEEEKIAITLSKGEFVAGDTFKLVY